MSGYCHNSWVWGEGKESPRMEESLGWGRRKEVFAEGPWQWVTRGARRADRVPSATHVCHVSPIVVSSPSSELQISNMQIKSSHLHPYHCQLCRMVHLCISLSRPLWWSKSISRVFDSVMIIHLYQVSEAWRRSYYPPYHLIISISLVFWCPLHSSSLCILYRLQVPSLGR